MNEKIKQLAEQAHLYNDNDSYLIAALENFASLILQDCITICEEMGDNGQDGHYCVDKIRREFGV